MNAPRWTTRKLRDGRYLVELAEPRAAFVALEIFPSCCACAPSYGLLALGADRTVVGWLRAGEA